MVTTGVGEALERPGHEHPFIEISAGEYRADISAFGGARVPSNVTAARCWSTTRAVSFRR